MSQPRSHVVHFVHYVACALGGSAVVIRFKVHLYRDRTKILLNHNTVMPPKYSDTYWHLRLINELPRVNIQEGKRHFMRKETPGT